MNKSWNQTLTSVLATMRIAPSYLAGFDSATAMLRAIAFYLRGQDFPGLGIAPPAIEPILDLINKLPRPIREVVYTYGSAAGAISPNQFGDVSGEIIAQWMVSEYQERQYPAVAIGSSNGALIHLYAALGIPWLPQTFLIPVKHSGIHPDEPKQVMQWGMEHARELLDANPDLQLHHMHDPNQDRLTAQGMTYFRMKRLRLGETYEHFLKNSLPSGGTIFLIECQRTWQTTQVGDRHIFQFGALGGAAPEEFFQGSERVAEYLNRYQSHRRQWDPPAPDGERPEAEWGFEPALRDDVERFAREQGFRVRRIVFKEPEDLSPFVAELYHWWYEQRQLLTNRLLVESFILQEPMWSLRTGSVPFWMVFNMEPSLKCLEQYLDTHSYDEIYMMLFSHGVDSVGLPPIERWRAVLNRAHQRGEFLGVEADKYPRHFASFMRYYTDLQRTIPARYPLPEPLAIQQLDKFIETSGERFPIHWLTTDPEHY